MSRDGAVSPSDFGTLLRHYRILASLSQEALAERSRLSVEAISALERGYRKTPQRDTLKLLITGLELTEEHRHELESAAARWVLLRKNAAHSGPKLPEQLTTFVGRHVELEQIAKLLRESRLVTITGAGGIGKTRTALHLASTSDLSDRTVCFVALASVSDPAVVGTTILAALRAHPDDRAPLEKLIGHLNTRPTLLILDNCEHLVAETARISETLLSEVPSAKILATSREPLRIAGERRYRLPPLTSDDAIALFTDRATAADHGFSLNDTAPNVVRGLCQRLDCIPLALELAAARVNASSPTALLDMLDDRFTLLDRGIRTALPHQQTLRATIEWSYELLSGPERRLFQRLSVFSGSFSIEAAKSTCSDGDVSARQVAQHLFNLVDKSIVTINGQFDEPRYELLESFQLYAKEKLRETGEQNAYFQRHARTYLGLAQQLGWAYETASDEVWQRLAQQDLDNWRSALKWSIVDGGDVDLGQRLVGDLRVVWYNLAPLEFVEWLRLANELVSKDTSPHARAALCYADLCIAMYNGHRNVTAVSDEALRSSILVGDELKGAFARFCLGDALASMGRIDEARPVLVDALAVSRRLGMCRQTALILRVFPGTLAERRAFLSEAQSIYKTIGASRMSLWALVDISECELTAGNTDLALRLASEAAEGLAEANDPRCSLALEVVSHCLILSDRYPEAKAYAHRASAIARQQRRILGVTEALGFLLYAAILQCRSDRSYANRHAASIFRVLAYATSRAGEFDESIWALGSQPDLGVLRELLGERDVQVLTAEGAQMSDERADEEAAAL
jgi:predicted ATPase/DNA-binding XRE family transcriptional regulator